VASQSTAVEPTAGLRSVFLLGVLTVQVGENALTRGDMCAVCAAVVAGVDLYLGDEFILVLGGD
jgi:hypothetical protein